jgi:hypothetical protein
VIYNFLSKNFEILKINFYIDSIYSLIKYNFD